MSLRLGPALALGVLTIMTAHDASARRNSVDTMTICRNAALTAAKRHGIPPAVMIAITIVETGTRRGGASGPWPWTVNVAGKGRWFDSRAAALLHAQSALAKGQKSFDVGCFQLNYRWHGHHFASIDEMFEPGPSGDYAARFLKSLHAETKDWVRASGMYHSRTEQHAKRYRGLIANALQRLGDDLVAVVADSETPGSGDTESARSWYRARGPLIVLGRQKTQPSAQLSRPSGGVGIGALMNNRTPLVGLGPAQEG